MLLFYQERPTYLVEKYDGKTSKNTFNLQHALQWKVGGLVTGGHNEVHDYLDLMVTQTVY